MKTYTKVIAAIAFVVVALALASISHAPQSARAQNANDWGPKWTSDGKLKLPEGYHEWVYLGSPLTPNALNDGAAAFPEYHNVYMQPEAYRHYKTAGEFPEGTIMLKELQLTQPAQFKDGSRQEVSGRGYFPGPRNGIDIAVKDSERFKDTNNWGYFNFGHHAPPYLETAPAAPRSACAQCHIDAADEDMVFTRFYAVLKK